MGKAAAGQRSSDWRKETLARIRTLIQEAEPEVVEEVKWRKPSNNNWNSLAVVG